MLFYICKKLTSHQMLSSTEILKWLREILICRNKFLLKNKVSEHYHLSVRIINMSCSLLCHFLYLPGYF